MAKYKLRDIYTKREKFKDKEELQERIDLFHEMCNDLRVPITYTGLMLVLGLNNKNQLSGLRYHEEYGEIVRSAIASVEFFYETQLSGGKPVGAIFALKNFGWSDRTDVTIADTDPHKVSVREAQLAVLNAVRKSLGQNQEPGLSEIEFIEDENPTECNTDS